MGESREYSSSPTDLLAYQLREALDTNRELARALDDELRQNTIVRTEICRDLQHLQRSLSNLERLVRDGNGNPATSLVHRIMAMKGEIKLLVANFKKYELELAKRDSEKSSNTALVVTTVVAIAVAILAFIGTIIGAFIQAK